MIENKDIPDCGDHSCYFSGHLGGMRTNGGCRCGDNPGGRSGHLVRYARLLQIELAQCKNKIKALEANLENALHRKPLFKTVEEYLASDMAKADEK